MISWIPLLGRNGLVNQMLMNAHLIDSPLEWLLYSPFSVALAFVHLFTFFMVVPIFNSMMRIDRALIEAAYDAGASGLADADGTSSSRCASPASSSARSSSSPS